MANVLDAYRKKQERLENLKKQLQEVSFSKAEHIYKNLVKIRKEKIRLLESMIEEAKDFKKLERIRLEKDESSLLSNLRHEVRKERRYLRFIKHIVEDYFMSISAPFESIYESYLLPMIQDKQLAKELYSEIQQFEHVLYHYHIKQKNLIDEEFSFLTKWKGGFFQFLTFRRKSVLKEFRANVLHMIELFKKEDESQSEVLGKLLELEKSIANKTDKLSLVSPQEFEPILKGLAKLHNRGLWSSYISNDKLSSNFDDSLFSLKSESFDLGAGGGDFPGGGGGRFGGGGASGEF